MTLVETTGRLASGQPRPLVLADEPIFAPSPPGLSERRNGRLATGHTCLARASISLQLRVPKALLAVVVDHTDALHEGVADGGADEGEAAFLERFRERIGFR